MRVSTGLLSAALALILPVALCASEDSSSKAKSRDKEKDEKPPASDAPLVWRDKITPGPAQELRIKRKPGKFLVYDGSLERSQQSKNAYHLDDKFYLTVLCADQAGGYDHVAIRRSNVDRKREETLENK